MPRAARGVLSLFTTTPDCIKYNIHCATLLTATILNKYAGIVKHPFSSGVIFSCYGAIRGVFLEDFWNPLFIVKQSYLLYIKSKGVRRAGALRPPSHLIYPFWR